MAGLRRDARPRVDPERCIRCGVCVCVCRAGVLELRSAGELAGLPLARCVVARLGACTGCLRCVEECPARAISL